MELSFSRSSKNILANWWWTVDKWLLAAIVGLLGFGLILSFSASPAVAQTNHYNTYHFVLRHCFYLCIASGVFFLSSMLNLKGVRRLALLTYVVFLFLAILTVFWGVEVKGARRWIDVGVRIQPSEFLKPVFIVCTAWLFEMNRRYKSFPGIWVSIILGLITCGILVLQHDFGMTIVVAVVWFVQLFLAGLPLKKLCLFACVLLLLAFCAYLALPHVQVRLGEFFAGIFNGTPSYQVKKSLEAFKNGSLFGVGVGEGVVKWHIPDAHTDFIFPVAAEEYGMILCVLIVAMYAFIVIRAMWLSGKEDNMFIVLSVCGLAISFGIQAFVNMASTLQIGPTKGMALPLISYGGSCLIGSALGMGMLLALTRKNIHAENKDDEG